MDMRYGTHSGMRDMRRLPPRNSRGEFRRRRSRRDRGMPYDMGYDYEGDMRERHYGEQDMRMDGHHYPMRGGRSGGYEPVEFMGYCTGYAGSPEDHASGRNSDYRDYDMRGRGRYDYGYPMYDSRGGRYRDYGYDDYGDYGETLSEKELDHWCKKLKSELDDQEKQMFSKEMISQKAKQMGLQMKGFGEKELEAATIMTYTDYKKTIGRNLDMAIRLAYDWLTDDDVAVKGAEKLAVYYDEIVAGDE